MRSTRFSLHRVQARLLTLALSSGTALAVTVSARATDQRAPEVPTDIAVPAGYRVHFHAYLLCD